MKLEEYVANEVEKIMAFNARWRELSKEKPDTFPLEQTNAEIWSLQSRHWFASRDLQKALKEDDEEKKKVASNAAANDRAA